jgi:hypothetical protein
MRSLPGAADQDNSVRVSKDVLATDWGIVVARRRSRRGAVRPERTADGRASIGNMTYYLMLVNSLECKSESGQCRGWICLTLLAVLSKRSRAERGRLWHSSSRPSRRGGRE